MINEKIKNLQECENCKDMQIKKFTPINTLEYYREINDEYKRCECGKRPLDVVMAHILKIMIEEKTVPENATLRHNTPVPLSELYYSNRNPQFINKKSLILLHPDFTQKTADRLLDEVSEVKGVLKGSPAQTVGQFDKNSEINTFQLLAGDDEQTNIVQTLLGDKIILSKKQSKNHIEVAMTTEQKLVQLHNYLKNNNIKTDVAADAMCGGGALGIYLLKYGFKKVIFNDIYPEAIETLKKNLELNGITEGYEIHNIDFELLNTGHADLCVIDAFPGSDISEIIKKGEEIADNLVII